MCQSRHFPAVNDDVRARPDTHLGCHVRVREDDPEDRRHRPGEVKEVEEKDMKEGETAEKRRESEREGEND